VRKTQRPGVGIAGPLKEGFEHEPGSFSELAAGKQRDRNRASRNNFQIIPLSRPRIEGPVRLELMTAQAADGKPRFATYRPAPDGRQSCGGQPPTRSNAGEAPAHEGVEEATS